MPVLGIAMDGWMDGCNACFKDCCGQKQIFSKKLLKEIMPVLRIAMDEWKDGCNARFKDCCGQKQKFSKKLLKTILEDVLSNLCKRKKKVLVK